MKHNNTNKWEIVIGLEIHAQLITNTKLFSSAAVLDYDETDGSPPLPNTSVSLVDAAMPGMLPTLNSGCVEQAIRACLGLNAKINLISRFDRKHYSYPDLPQGYQITQFYKPIAYDGYIDIPVLTTMSSTELHDDISDKKAEFSDKKRIKINRIHIEQDAGKIIRNNLLNSEVLIDLNRCGVALIEIVTDPDFRSTKEVRYYIEELRRVLQYLGVCSGDMEKGSMRCDINLSVRHLGDDTLGTRVEIKNVNSIRNIEKAIEYEADRQIRLIESGRILEIIQETRLFDDVSLETKRMREKENAADYRYFPDPDLPMLKIDEIYLQDIKATLPELPQAKLARYIDDFGLSYYDASVIVADKNVAEYFEELINIKSIDPKIASNWLTTELFSRLKKQKMGINTSHVTAIKFAALLNFITTQTISTTAAKSILDEMAATGAEASYIIDRDGLFQISDEVMIKGFIEEVLAENSDKIAEYKNGKEKLLAFFIGQVVKKSAGRVNLSLAKQLLLQALQNG